MRQELVSEEKLLEGESVEIHCAHGDTVLYPVAELTETRYSTMWQSSRRHGPCGRARSGDRRVEIESGGSCVQVPMSMLVGTDIPQLLVLLQEELPEPVTRDSMREDALLVVTRSQVERERRAGEAALQREEQSGAVPRSLEKLESQELEESVPVLTEEEQLSEFPVFAEDLFVTGQTKSRSPGVRRGLREGVTGLRTTPQAMMMRQSQHAIARADSGGGGVMGVATPPNDFKKPRPSWSEV